MVWVQERAISSLPRVSKLNICSVLFFPQKRIHDGHLRAQMYLIPCDSSTIDSSCILMEHRIEQTQTYICKCFFILFFLLQVYKTWQTNLWKWSYLQKQVLKVGGGAGQACCAGFSSVMKMVMMKTWQAMFGRQTMKDKNKCERLIATGIPRCWNRFLFCRFNCRLPQVSFDPPLQSRPILLDQDILNTTSVEKDNNLWVLKNFSFKQQITLRVCGFSKNVSSHH